MKNRHHASRAAPGGFALLILLIAMAIPLTGWMAVSSGGKNRITPNSHNQLPSLPTLLLQHRAAVLKEHSLDLINVHLSKEILRLLNLLDIVNITHMGLYYAYIVATIAPPVKAKILAAILKLYAVEKLIIYAVPVYMQLWANSLCHKNNLGACIMVRDSAVQPFYRLIVEDRVPDADVAPGYLQLSDQDKKDGYYVAVLPIMANATMLTSVLRSSPHNAPFFEHNLMCIRITFTRANSLLPSFKAQSALCAPTYWISL